MFGIPNVGVTVGGRRNSNASNCLSEFSSTQPYLAALLCIGLLRQSLLNCKVLFSGRQLLILIFADS